MTSSFSDLPPSEDRTLAVVDPAVMPPFSKKKSPIPFFSSWKIVFSIGSAFGIGLGLGYLGAHLSGVFHPPSQDHMILEKIDHLEQTLSQTLTTTISPLKADFFAGHAALEQKISALSSTLSSLPSSSSALPSQVPSSSSASSQNTQALMESLNALLKKVDEKWTSFPPPVSPSSSPQDLVPVQAFRVFLETFNKGAPYRKALIPLRTVASGEVLATLDAYAETGAPQRADLEQKLDLLLKKEFDPPVSSATFPQATNRWPFLIEKIIPYLTGLIHIETDDLAQHRAWQQTLRTIKPLFQEHKDLEILRHLDLPSPPPDVAAWISAFKTYRALEEARDRLARDVLS